MLDYLKEDGPTKPMEMPMELKNYDIWIGKYHLGQGHDAPAAPQKVATVRGASFAIACLKLELSSMMSMIMQKEDSKEYIDQQSCRWFYNYDTNSNGWTGKYFETEEQAWRSFPEKPNLIIVP